MLTSLGVEEGGSSAGSGKSEGAKVIGSAIGECERAIGSDMGRGVKGMDNSGREAAMPSRGETDHSRGKSMEGRLRLSPLLESSISGGMESGLAMMTPAVGDPGLARSIGECDREGLKHGPWSS